MRKNRRSQTRVNLQIGCLAVFFILSGEAFAEGKKLTAAQIMEKTFASRQLSGAESVMSLTIINEKGKKRVREIAVVTKMFDKGKTEKKLYRFLSPADVKGTGVLAFDYEKKEDDMWIFLPALRKTRRIVSSDKSKNFMGSEFSYADMNRPQLENYKLKIVKEEKVEGTDCWMIEALPKSNEVAEDEGYKKKEVWIAKSDYMPRKQHYYDMDGKLLKVLTAKNAKLVDKANKKYRLMYMEMVNKQNGRKSVFKTSKVDHSPNADDNYFTTSYLERP